MARTRKRECRPIDGIFLLDKPEGMSSNRAVQEVKRRLQACKAGHTGSLDPLATGLLPVCLGEATKVSQYLLDADKTYRTTLQLGVSTTTFDREGEVTAVRPVAVERAQVEATLADFRGCIRQRPPVYSAIKQGGQPIYKKARAGAEVVVAPREVVVRRLEMVAFAGDRLTLEAQVSKGTYIRSLAHDLGEVLGCGAHVVELRRSGLGRLNLDQAHPLEALSSDARPEVISGLLLPIDQALAGFAAMHLSADNGDRLHRGQPIFVGPAEGGGPVRVYREDQFLGIGDVSPDGWLTARRLRASVPETGFPPEKSVEGGGWRG